MGSFFSKNIKADVVYHVDDETLGTASKELDKAGMEELMKIAAECMKNNRPIRVLKIIYEDKYRPGAFCMQETLRAYYRPAHPLLS